VKSECVATGFWGAHAPRVRARRLAERTFFAGRNEEDFGVAPKSARAARALPRRSAFTVIELLVVMAIIVILAGLILATSNYVQKKGYRSRAEAEIAAISAALENYKADNGVYPTTAVPNAKTDYYPNGANKADYESASQVLYVALSADTNRNRVIDTGETAKSYFSFKPSNLTPQDQSALVVGIRDPFGNLYGYSTANQSSSANGYNPTFDLWSTCGNKETSETEAQYLARWIKNW